jgi:phage terminase large subunit
MEEPGSSSASRVTKLVIDYAPRPQFLEYHNRDKRFSCIVAHRRAGKTVACVNDLLKAALTCKKPNGRFGYIAPQFNQVKDIAWAYLKRFADPVLQYGGKVNESELRLELPNGAQIRLYGADNPDRLRGVYFDGVVLDEYATMDPRIWEVVRPALSDREGWCTWIGTPNGHNDFYKVWQRSQAEDNWFSLRLRASETNIIAAHELVSAKRDLTPDQFAQEYECSFEAAIQGAYYGADMAEAEKTNRITNVPYDKSCEVMTAWDLGIGDATAIWFCQLIGQEIHLIDYLENSGVGLDWYAKEIKAKPYVYGPHILPHDVEAKELGTGKSRREVLEDLGIKVDIAPRLGVDDGINAVRNILDRCWFDKTKTTRGIEALKQYKAEWDDKGRVFRRKPLHDWTSHGADAFRYLATGMKKSTKGQWTKDVMNFNVDWAA